MTARDVGIVGLGAAAVAFMVLWLRACVVAWQAEKSRASWKEIAAAWEQNTAMAQRISDTWRVFAIEQVAHRGRLANELRQARERIGDVTDPDDPMKGEPT